MGAGNRWSCDTGLAGTDPVTDSRTSGRRAYPERYHRIDGNTRLSSDQYICYSQDRALTKYYTWRTADRNGKLRFGHSSGIYTWYCPDHCRDSAVAIAVSPVIRK